MPPRHEITWWPCSSTADMVAKRSGPAFNDCTVLTMLHVSRYEIQQPLVQRLWIFKAILMQCQSTWRKLETPRHKRNALWGWTPHQKSNRAKVGPRDGVCRQLSLLRPKFVHALTSGIQPVMDNQALRRAFFLLLNLSHADVVVALTEDDKPGNDTEYSPEESLWIGKPLHDLEAKYAFAALSIERLYTIEVSAPSAKAPGRYTVAISLCSCFNSLLLRTITESNIETPPRAHTLHDLSMTRLLSTGVSALG
jgi:hypothetical protein